MRLSIIIPNYNNDKYLPDCLESVISQTYRPDEVIVTDDASTDGSVQIIKKYEKKYSFIKGIYHQVNRGVAVNRHHAILQAKGDYITLLDSDDYYFCAQKLEKEMSLIKKFRVIYNKEIIAYSNIILVDENKNMEDKMFSTYNIVEGDIFSSVITRSNPVPRDFIMSKNQYMAAGGYDSSIKLYEDWDLVVRLARHNEFYYTDTDGTAYRRHGKGLSSLSVREHVKWLDIVFHKNIELINNSCLNSINRNYNIFLLQLLVNNLNIESMDQSIMAEILERLITNDDAKRKKVKSLLEKIKANARVVLYGAGKHTERLLLLPECRKINIIKIIDKDQSLKGKKIHGIEVTSPDEIEKINPDIIIISSFAYQEQIEEELFKIHNFKKEILKLYSPDDKGPFYQL